MEPWGGGVLTVQAPPLPAPLCSSPGWEPGLGGAVRGEQDKQWQCQTTAHTPTPHDYLRILFQKLRPQEGGGSLPSTGQTL